MRWKPQTWGKHDKGSDGRLHRLQGPPDSIAEEMLVEADERRLTFWDELLIAFLLEPPEAALLSPDEAEKRAEQYIRAIISGGVKSKQLQDIKRQVREGLGGEALPLPDPASVPGCFGEARGTLTVRHPISRVPAWKLSTYDVSANDVLSVLTGLVQVLTDPCARFLAVWRLLPDRLAERRPWFRSLPADARAPGHSIWHAADARAGFYAAEKDGPPALLSFQLGPVQPFIAAARSVLDLWSGSAILSWLAFQAMLPIIEGLGPTAVVFPRLRGVPLLDLWLRDRKSLSSVQEPSERARKAPCIPNRFLAVVPWGENGASAGALAEQCRTCVRQAWVKGAGQVRDKLKKLPSAYHGWDSRWDDQVESFFEIRTSIMPASSIPDQDIETLLGEKCFSDPASDAAKVRALANAVPSTEAGHRQRSAGRWQALAELSGRLMAAQRTVAHFPKSTKAAPPSEEFPGKCSLMGSFEQMGPSDFEGSRKFWEAAADPAKGLRIRRPRVRKGDRLCAVALAKRFAAPVFLAQELRFKPDELGFPDTATVAAAQWLCEARIDPEQVWRAHGVWNGQWLHWPCPNYDKDEEGVPGENDGSLWLWNRIQEAKKELGKPPTYYAILAMDADWMGEWLQGKKAPHVEDILHPSVIQYFNQRRASNSLAARRPVTPAAHAAISEALINFAVHVAPAVVGDHRGTLIYSGGDDVLALFPLRTSPSFRQTHATPTGQCPPAKTVLTCALELYRAFRGEDAGKAGTVKGYYKDGDRELLMMGPDATLSAGVAIVHYKDDLRLSLEAARRAERAAKEGGRDALQLAICRRSGEHSSALVTWNTVPFFDQLVSAFAAGASDRWTYHLHADRDTLSTLPEEAVCAEIRRQVDRAEKQTRDLLRGTDDRTAGKVIEDAFMRYAKSRQDAESRPGSGERGKKPVGSFLCDFLTLCQSASFFVRGESK